MAAYFGYLLLAGIQIPFCCKRDPLNGRLFDVKKYLYLCCFELILLAGFRGYTVGADTATYLSALDYYGSLPASELMTAELVYPYRYEIGYFTLTKLSVLFGLGKTPFLFLVAALIYIPTFVTIKKYSPMPYISILCYFALGFFSYSLGIFRQMIAISILFCGWKYIEERRLVKYMLLVGMAMTFHTTAAAGVILYFLYGMNWRRVAIWLLPIEIFVLLFGRQIALLLVKLFSRYTTYVGGRFDIQGGTYLMLVLLNIVLVASILVQDEKREKNESVTICALILAICLQCVGYAMGAIGRGVTYYSIYLIFAIPNVLCNLRSRIGDGWASVVSFFGIICLFVLAFTNFNGNYYVVPYYTIFS